MPPRGSNELTETFRGLDRDGDGLVSLECLRSQLLQSSGASITKDELASLIGKSSLDVQEFTLLYNSIEIQNDVEFVDVACDEDEEGCVMKAFKVFDVDGDGFISVEELEIVLKRLGIWKDDRNISGGKEKDPTAMICKFDKNFDGLLDFEEFKTMVMSR